MMVKVRWLAVSLACLFFCSACAHLSLKSPTEESLRETVDKVWTSKTQRKWGPVYDQANEEYKAQVEREDFIRRSNLRVVSYSIREIRMTGPGKAAVTLGFTVNFTGTDFSGTAEEEWLWEKGEWRVNMMPQLNTPFGSFAKPPAPKK